MAKKKKKTYKKIRPSISRVIDVFDRYYPKRFPNSKEKREKAKEIVSKLKLTGESATVANILSLIRKKRGEKFVPVLPEEMSSVQNYFILVKYPDLILTEVDPKITLISRVSNPNLPPIKGLTEIDYEEYFGDFVRYCNDLAGLAEEGRYEEDWFVTTRLIDEERYIFEIIPCTGDGKEFYYKFDVNNLEKKPRKTVTTEVGKPKEETKTTETTIGEKKDDKPSVDRVKEIRALIDDLRKDLKDNLITKKFYQSEVAKLIAKLEEGGNIT